jgi:hypothetical protein
MPIHAGCERSLNENRKCFGMAYNYVGKKRAVTVLWDYEKFHFFFFFLSFRFFTYCVFMV